MVCLKTRHGWLQSDGNSYKSSGLLGHHPLWRGADGKGGKSFPENVLNRASGLICKQIRSLAQDFLVTFVGQLVNCQSFHYQGNGPDDESRLRTALIRLKTEQFSELCMKSIGHMSETMCWITRSTYRGQRQGVVGRWEPACQLSVVPYTERTKRVAVLSNPRTSLYG